MFMRFQDDALFLERRLVLFQRIENFFFNNRDVPDISDMGIMPGPGEIPVALDALAFDRNQRSAFYVAIRIRTKYLLPQFRHESVESPAPPERRAMWH